MAAIIIDTLRRFWLQQDAAGAATGRMVFWRLQLPLTMLVLFSLYFLTIKSVLLFAGPYPVARLIGTPHLFWYLAGPLLFLSIRLLVNPNRRPSAADAAHLYPFMIYLFLSYPFFILDAQQKMEMYLVHINNSAAVDIYRFLLFQFTALFFWLGGRKLVSGQTKPTKNNHFLGRGARLPAFLKVAAAGVSLIALLILIRQFYGYPNFALQYSVYYLSSLAALVSSVTLLRARDGILDTFSKGEIENKNLPDSDRPRYSNSTLTLQEVHLLTRKLKRLMIEQRPFLDAHLNLDTLAETLGIPAHHLSQVLSQGLGTNFYRYVNRHRIEAAKALLIDTRYNHLTIFAVALEAGFGNKASFNKIFKEETGMTPSAFKRNAPI